MLEISKISTNKFHLFIVVLALLKALVFLINFYMNYENSIVTFRNIKGIPLPIVFDRPHYFADRSMTVIEKDKNTKRINEQDLYKKLEGPWHYKILYRHMFLYLFKKNPSHFEHIVQNHICTILNLEPEELIFDWDYSDYNKLSKQKEKNVQVKIKCQNV